MPNAILIVNTWPLSGGGPIRSVFYNPACDSQWTISTNVVIFPRSLTLSPDVKCHELPLHLSAHCCRTKPVITFKDVYSNWIAIIRWPRNLLRTIWHEFLLPDNCSDCFLILHIPAPCLVPTPAVPNGFDSLRVYTRTIADNAGKWGRMGATDGLRTGMLIFSG